MGSPRPHKQYSIKKNITRWQLHFTLGLDRYAYIDLIGKKHLIDVPESHNWRSGKGPSSPPIILIYDLMMQTEYGHNRWRWSRQILTRGPSCYQIMYQLLLHLVLLLHNPDQCNLKAHAVTQHHVQNKYRINRMKKNRFSVVVLGQKTQATQKLKP